MTKLDCPFVGDSDVLDFVRLFESCHLPYVRWTHRGHLAVAVVYVRRYPLEEAIDRVRQAIRRYNESRGDFVGYHETITQLFVQIVADEMAHSPAGLAAWVNTVYDRWPMDRVLDYYSKELLWSPAARLGWVEPDLQPLDFVGEHAWHVET